VTSEPWSIPFKLYNGNFTRKRGFEWQIRALSLILTNLQPVQIIGQPARRPSSQMACGHCDCEGLSRLQRGLRSLSRASAKSDKLSSTLQIRSLIFAEVIFD
jgi:hypothetical protein